MRTNPIDSTTQSAIARAVSQSTITGLPPLEDLIPLADLPARIPAAAGGRRLHCHVPYRWADKGLGGVLLRTVRLPGIGKVTTLDWFREFATAVAAARGGAAAAAPPPRPRSGRQQPNNDRAAETQQVLARHDLA